MRAFVSWWFRQLGSLVPARVRLALRAPPDAVLVELAQGSGLALALRRGGALSPAGQIPALAGGAPDVPALVAALVRLPGTRGLPLRLRAPGLTLEKRLTLPAVVRADLDRLLGFEIDRETPFEATDLYWVHDLLAGPGPPSQLVVTLTLLPRALLEPLVLPLREAGLAPDGVELGPSARLAPLEGAARPRGTALRRPLRVAAVAVGALALLALALPFVERQLLLTRLDAAIAADGEVARVASTLAARLADPAGEARLLEAGGHLPQAALAALAALTERVPDGAFVQALELRGGSLALRGLAGSATGLVTNLAQDPLLTSPVLTAPVITEGAREQFALALTIAGVPAVSGSAAGSEGGP